MVLCVRDCENKMNSDKLSVLGELNCCGAVRERL